MGTDDALSDPLWIEPWTRGQGDARARGLMDRTWFVQPDAVWSAPGRVTMIGEHTDYSGGITLPTVIAHRTYIAARLRDDGVIRVVSEGAGALAGPGEQWEGNLDDIAAGTVTGWPSYVAGVVWALRERGYDGPGMDLAIASCVPIDAGLSSSGALLGATARAVNALWRLSLDSDDAQAELAEACRDAQEVIAGSSAGGLDHHTILRCREGEAVQLDFSVQPPLLRHCPLYFPDYGLGLLVIDARSPQRNSVVGLNTRMAECRAAADALGVAKLADLVDFPEARRRIRSLDPLLRRRARHVITEIERVREVTAELANTGPAHERFTQIGKLLYQSHASLEVDFEISTPEQNLAVDTAYHSGALGARLVGAGFGGSSIALVRRSEAKATARRIDRAFVDAGRERPNFLFV